MIWIVDCFSFQVFQFGDPVSDIIAVGITFLGLGYRVEDSLVVSLFSSEAREAVKGESEGGGEEQERERR
jgi:hypothetical protein